jgi:hypothetical protein
MSTTWLYIETNFKGVKSWVGVPAPQPEQLDWLFCANCNTPRWHKLVVDVRRVEDTYHLCNGCGEEKGVSKTLKVC